MKIKLLVCKLFGHKEKRKCTDYEGTCYCERCNEVIMTHSEKVVFGLLRKKEPKR